MAHVKKFKKYEFEDIRTDYLPLDAPHKANTQASVVIPSRTLISFASADDTNTPKKFLKYEIIPSATDITDANIKTDSSTAKNFFIIGNPPLFNNITYTF